MFALAGAASLSAIGASFYASTIPPFSDTNTPWRLIFPGSIALVSLAAAVILLVAGKNSHRRSTRNDATGSALAALESYLAPLPEPAQYLIRATMTTNLLQVSGTDADLLMLKSWPSPSDLMTTIYAVSYTHLDVYKRQHQYLPLSSDTRKSVSIRKGTNGIIKFLITSKFTPHPTAHSVV